MKLQFTECQKYEICNLYKSGLSIIKISKKFNLSCKPIRRILNEYKISLRSFRESCKGNNLKVTYSDQKEICKLYIDGKSSKEISYKFDVYSQTIIRILRKNNVKIRNNSECKKGISNKKLQIKFSEKELNNIIESYIGGKNVCEISSYFNVSPATIQRILKRNGKLKTNSEAKKGKVCLENNPNWNNGSSFFPYCPKFNNAKKEEIRNKYGRKCIICDKPEVENITKSGKFKKLHIHHVDYNKLQGCENNKWILVPLCNTCHMKTNAKNHRDEWKNIIINIINLEENVEDIRK